MEIKLEKVLDAVMAIFVIVSAVIVMVVFAALALEFIITIGRY